MLAITTLYTKMCNGGGGFRLFSVFPSRPPFGGYMNNSSKAGILLASILFVAVLTTVVVPTSDAATYDMEKFAQKYGLTETADGTYTHNGNLELSEIVTLDLEGNTLSFTSGGIVTSKTLTINDSVGTGKIQSSDGNSPLITNTGSNTTTLNSGTLESNNVAVKLADGNFVMKGGKISAPVAVQQGAAKNLNLEGGTIESSGTCVIDTSAKNIKVTGISINLTTSEAVTDGVVLKTSNSAIIFEYGDMKISGNGTGVLFSTDESSSVTINGGEFNGTFLDSDNKGAVSIYGGSFENDNLNDFVGGNVSIFGGKFSADPGTQNIVEGNTYKNGCVQSSSSSPLVTTADGTGYNSLFLAFKAAPFGTPTVLTLNGPVSETEAFTLLKGKDITVDINGQNVSLVGKLTINGNAKLTFENTGNTEGGVTYTSKSQLSVNTNGEMNLKDVKLEMTASYIVASGNFSMEGGSVTGSVGQYGLIYGSSEVKILSGEVIGDDIHAVRGTSGSTLIFGSSNSDGPYISSIQVSKTVGVQFLSGKIGSVAGTLSDSSVLDGIFVEDISDSLPEGKGLVPTTGGWQVVDVTENDAVAKIGTVYYASFASAIRNVDNGETLVLLKDCEGLGSTAYASSFTVDLNGHSFKCTGTNSAAISIDADLTNGAGTVAITNSGTSLSTIESDYIAIDVSTKNDSDYGLTITIDEDVILKTAEGGRPLNLSDNSRVLNTETNAGYVTHGGFIATVDNSEYIYGGLTDALKATTTTLSNDSTTKLVKLHNDTSYGLSIHIGGNWAIDLDGHTVSSNTTDAVTIGGSNNNLTIMNGNIVGTNTSERASGIALALPPGGSTSYQSSSVTLDRVSMKLAGAYGVVTNGSCTDMTVMMIDSSIEGADYGVYFPGTGTLTVTDTDITGDSVGIEIRNGSLNISGDSTITGGDKFEDPVPNGSGTTCHGVAVAVSQHGGSAKVNVNITGGTFKGAYGLYEVSLQGNEPASKMSITGGTFKAPVYSENVTDFISNSDTGAGPVFSNDVTDYCSDGLAAKLDDNGMYVVATAVDVTFQYGGQTSVVPVATGTAVPSEKIPTTPGYTYTWTVGGSPWYPASIVENEIIVVGTPKLTAPTVDYVVGINDLTATVTVTATHPAATEFTYSAVGPSNEPVTMSGNVLSTQLPGDYVITVTAKDSAGLTSEATVSVTVSFEVSSEGSVTVDVMPGETTVDVVVDGITFEFEDLSHGNLSVTVDEVASEAVPGYGPPATTYEIIMSGSAWTPGKEITVSVPVSIPDGQRIVSGSVTVLYIPDDGSVPVDMDAYIGSDDRTIVFTTTHNSKYAVFYDLEAIPESDQPFIPFPDDDDDYVPLPPHIVYEDEDGSDDSVKIAACAAAAVIAAILAIVLATTYRRR